MTDSLKHHVEQITKLPSIPSIAHEILSLADDDMVSVAKLETIIKKDPSIAAKILSVANSAFFGSKTPTTTISNAIVRIGFNNVKNIAIGISIMTVLEDGGHENKFYYQRIFKHSAIVGIISKVIAKNLGMPTHEEMLINGLLHDIGYLVENKYFNDSYMKVLAEFDGKMSILEAEQNVFGFIHSDIGAWLTEKWKLPKTVYESVLYHHAPSRLQDNQTHVAAVHLADCITSSNIFSVPKSDPKYPFDNASLEILGITEQQKTEIEQEIINNSPANELLF